MRNMKERMTICCIVLLFLCMLFSTAFLSGGGKAENILTFGRLRLQLINHTVDEDGQEVAVTEENEKLNGTKVSRIIKIKNICEHPMYVRVRIDFKGEDDQKPFSAEEYVSFNSPNAKWSQKEEWFYFSDSLEPGCETDNLLTELTFDLDRLMTDHAGSNITFTVYAQAVQSEHNGYTAEMAKGWPQEAGE